MSDAEIDDEDEEDDDDEDFMDEPSVDFESKSMKDMTLEDIDQITFVDMEGNEVSLKLDDLGLNDPDDITGLQDQLKSAMDKIEKVEQLNDDFADFMLQVPEDKDLRDADFKRYLQKSRGWTDQDWEEIFELLGMEREKDDVLVAELKFASELAEILQDYQAAQKMSDLSSAMRYEKMARKLYHDHQMEILREEAGDTPLTPMEEMELEQALDVEFEQMLQLFMMNQE